MKMQLMLVIQVKVNKKVTKGTVDRHFFRHLIDDEAFTTVSYIKSKPLEANENNTNTLSFNVIQFETGN